MLIKLLKHELVNGLQRKISILVISAITLACLDLIFISSLYPIIRLISDNTLINDYEFLSEVSLTAIFISYTFAMGALSLIRYVLLTRINLGMFQVGANLNSKIMSTVLNSSYENIYSIKRSIFIDNFTTKTNQLIYQVIFPAFQFMINFVLLIIIFISIVYISGWYGLTTILLVVALYYLMTLRTKKTVSKLSESATVSNEAMIKRVADITIGLREIKLDSREISTAHKFEKNELDLRRIQSDLLTVSISPRYILEYIFVIIVVMVLFYIKQNNYSLNSADLITGLAIIARTLPAANSLYQNIITIRGAANGFTSLLKTYETATKHASPENRIRHSEFKEIVVDKVCKNFIGGIHCTYPEIELKRNDKVAITGSSGRGKSTLLDLISGLLQPDTGHITVYGRDRKTIKLGKEDVSYISQNPYIDEQLEKINIESILQDSKYQNWLKVLKLEETLKKKPDQWGENMCNFSGGERCRIALLLAIHKERPILILDETLSAIQEQDALQVADQLLQEDNVTVICVTHNETLSSKFNKHQSI